MDEALPERTAKDGGLPGEYLEPGGNRAAAPVFPAAPDTAGARAALVASEVSELTGRPVGDAAVVELYPGYDNREKRARAMKMFIAEGRTFPEIARMLGVEERVVKMWSYVGRWARIVEREVLADRESERVVLERLRIRHREETMKEQLEAAKTVRTKAVEQARLADTAGQVKNAAEAVKAMADVETRVLGIDESGAIEIGEGSDAQSRQEKDGKKPLVIILNNNGNPAGLPDVRNAQ